MKTKISASFLFPLELMSEDGAHLFLGVVLWCAGGGAGFGCRHGAGEDRISALHVKTRLCDLSTSRFPLCALRRITHSLHNSVHVC